MTSNAPTRTAPDQERQPPWLTVTIREVMVKLTDRAFVIGTFATLAMIVLAVAASVFFSSRPETMNVVVTSPESAAMAAAVGDAAHAADDRYSVDLTTVDTADAAESLVRDGDADVFVDQVDGRWQLTYDSSPDATFEQYFSQVLSSQTIAALAQEAGASPGDVAQAMGFDSETLGGDAAQGVIGYIAGLAFAVLFLMSSMTYGMQIAQSVIEEKQSRIVEILVSVIPVRQLLAGKVIGNTLLSFGQMVLMLGTALIGIGFTPFKDMLPSFSSAIGWFLLFFLAGFLALACVWAAAGAMGTRSEDLQQTSQPLIWVLMVVYMAGFLASGTAQVVLSFVPIASSVLMPVRLVQGTVAWWEPVVALLINVAFSVLTVLLGERIYRRALLQTQGRLTYKQALALTD
ncbi:hypothetical protein GCM10009785_04390 [Brooklawnia cerclae]|uniref:ABC-2 type transport system permease protein n=1 Tax=Brooklawnia cerclae TaxID=349934 RepID=A0ABX0SC53_9ACTN|nr:ABC transporter permease [Brooklawnia cerclae]NIH55970.1 ABC-2 type transport system permease protein [Brooklawnia cerclae]